MHLKTIPFLAAASLIIGCDHSTTTGADTIPPQMELATVDSLIDTISFPKKYFFKNLKMVQYDPDNNERGEVNFEQLDNKYDSLLVHQINDSTTYCTYFKNNQPNTDTLRFSTQHPDFSSNNSGHTPFPSIVINGEEHQLLYYAQSCCATPFQPTGHIHFYYNRFYYSSKYGFILNRTSDDHFEYIHSEDWNQEEVNTLIDSIISKIPRRGVPTFY